MSALNEPHFTTEEAARAKVEGIRWPNGPVCGHCGEAARRYATKRPGRYRCGNPECRKDYTVTTGTVMESSHIPLHKWLQGFYLVASSKKGFSAHQLHRTLGITYKSAWFMHHRIREAMRAGGIDVPPMGGGGKIVEADETYIGKIDKPRARNPHSPPPTKRGRSGSAGKCIVVGLVERGGNVRTFSVPYATKDVLTKIVTDNVSKEARLFTDESPLYVGSDARHAEHSTVLHSRKEYARGEIHTNTIEGYFGIFKRGMRGVYQHCREKHLHRYLAEFDFRYNSRSISDAERAVLAVKGAEGKRLTYRQPH